MEGQQLPRGVAYVVKNNARDVSNTPNIPNTPNTSEAKALQSSTNSTQTHSTVSSRTTLRARPTAQSISLTESSESAQPVAAAPGELAHLATLQASAHTAAPSPASSDAGERQHRDMVAKFRRRLAEELGDDCVERYFDGQTKLRLNNQQAEVTVASGLLAKLLDSKYGVQIRRTVSELVGGGQPVDVQFRVDRQSFFSLGTVETSLNGSSNSQSRPGVSTQSTDGAEATEIDAGSDPVGPAYAYGYTPVSNNAFARNHASTTGMRIEPVAGTRSGIGQPRTVAIQQSKPVAGVHVTPGLIPGTHARFGKARASVPMSLSRFTFDSFLVGKSNRLAHAAVTRIAEHDGYVAPVFLHGPCGLGKTHLLQAAVCRFLQLRPDACVRYTTGEAFTNEFVAAIKANKIDAFRKAYRRVDLLAIDDVHFFAGKEATQAEILHTFDAVGMEGARLIIASDEHPKDIAKLSERLLSRFMGGIVVKVDAPDRELRERLVRQLAQKRGLRFEEAALSIIVDRTERSIGSMGGFGGSVRELEGLMNQIDAVHRLIPELTSENGVVGAMLVRKALGLSAEEADRPQDAAPSGRPRRPIAGDVVLGEVCKALHVEISEVFGKGRHPRVVLARALTAYLCRTLTTLSFPEIARIMGRDNHSTVITAHKRFEQQMAQGLSPVEALQGTYGGLTLREVSEALAQVIAKASR